MTRHTRRAGVIAALAAATLALSSCGFSGLYAANLPGGADLGSHPYKVVAYFTDVLDLVPQSAVKINDVAVGKVDSIRLSNSNDTDSGSPDTNGWTARVTFSVRGDVHLPANSRAAIKMTSLLGEKYLELDQPTDQPSAASLHNGSVIPLTSTGTAPEVEEVLGALSLLLNGGGLQQIRIITTELNKALKGNEGAVRDLLTQLNTFVGSLDQQKNQITDALVSINKLAATLNAQKQTIVSALDTLPQALQILKDDRAQLTTLLTSLASLGSVASRVVVETQQNFVSSLQSLSPVLEQLTASGQNLPAALHIALSFPFPIGTSREMARGDYANLALFLDLNLTNELCGLNSALCNIPTKASTSSTPLATQSGAASVLQPGLLGLGG